MLESPSYRFGSPTQEAAVRHGTVNQSWPKEKVSSMGSVCRPAKRRTVLWLSFVLSGAALPWTAFAQLGPTSQYQLSDSIYLDEADSTARRHLTQVQAFLDASQWDEAIETLRHVSGDYGDKVVALGERRYLNVRDYCQLQFCSLPAEALALYRSRVDSQAREWFEEGVARRDKALLRRVVDQFFASSSGDDALDALGEIWLEEGDYGAARSAWRRLVPRDADVSPDSAAVTRMIAYPDTDLDPGRLRARLTLVSVLEGDLPRAERELEELRLRHPDAVGRLAGREVNLVEGLTTLLANSREWPALIEDSSWSTFGGTPERTATMPPLADVGAYLWHQKLESVSVEALASIAYGLPQKRPAEKHGHLLSYHPLVVGDIVLVNNDRVIRAFDLRTGAPVWPSTVVEAQGEPIPETEVGRFFWDEKRRGSTPNRPRHLGAPRFTMTVYGTKLFVRMGSCITAVAPEISPQMTPGYLVCIDLAAQGKQVWRVNPQEEKWAYEGAPVCDGKNVYVAMRRSDVRPQAHVACLDAETGQERWRRFICAAETPGRGQINESTHNLLTLHRGMLYLNTNLGAVAALSCEDGRLAWITLYKRAQSGDLSQPASHFYRDLNPCVYDRGRLFFAPSDSEPIIALEADTGEILWESAPHPDTAIHLLGVGAGNLIASGESLWWINVETGKLVGSEKKLPGYGHGALVGDHVYFPTERTIEVYDQRFPRHVKSISLADKATDVAGEPQDEPFQITGGNLLVARNQLFIATSNSLIALSQYSRQRERAPQQTALERGADLASASQSTERAETGRANRRDERRRLTAPRVTFRNERN